MHARQPAFRLAVTALLLAGCGSITTGGTAETSAPGLAADRIPIEVTRPPVTAPSPRW